MFLHRVRLLNFRQHVESEIEFGTGITAIIGPNGSGKTTILEAIGWAFYGLKATRGNKNTIRWSGARARSQVKVEVEFTLNSHTYRVVRGLNNAELYLDGGPRPVVNSSTEVTARLQQVIGMDREEFFNTYFTSQKELAVMASLGPTDRARFLSRVLGYEKLKVMQDRLSVSRKELRAGIAAIGPVAADAEALKDELAAAEARVTDCRNGVREVEERLGDARKNLDDVGARWTAIVEKREARQALDSDRKVALQRVNESRSEVERVDREMAAAAAARNELKKIEPELADVAALREELDGLEKEAQKAGRKRELLGQIDEVGSEIARVGERLAELESVDAALAEIQRAVEEKHAALHRAQEEEERLRTRWVQDRQEAATKRESLLTQFQDIERHSADLRELGPDGSCPMCRRQLGDEFESVIGSLAEQLEEIKINGKFFKQRVDQLEEPPEDYTRALEALKEATADGDVAQQELARVQALADERAKLEKERTERETHARALKGEHDGLGVSYDPRRHDEVRGRLADIQPVVEKSISLRTQAGRAEALVKEAEAAESLLTRREEEMARIEERLKELAFDENDYNQTRDLHEAAASEVRKLELDVVSKKADSRAAGDAVKAISERIAENERRMEAVRGFQKDLRVNEALDGALKSLRQELNARMRPDISVIASDFLTDLTDARYREMELNDQYEVVIVEDGEAKPIISGGEEDIANLVLRLAISQMVAERSGHPLSLLVLDEIFGSLDESRRHNVVELLRKLGDRFPQVILISHIESVREGVDRVITIAVDPSTGASHLKEEIGGAHIAA